MFRLIFLFIVFAVSLSASPFFDSSVYVIVNKANVRDNYTTSSNVIFQASKNQVFKFLDYIESSKYGWYKIEWYNRDKYDIYYKVISRKPVTGLNFQETIDLYEKPNKNSRKITILPTKGNIKYDNKSTGKRKWKRMRLYKKEIGYVSSSLVRKIDRPYFLVELALYSISKYGAYWSDDNKQRILDGVLVYNMTSKMVYAIKGSPDKKDKDPTGKNRYFTWWYGSQAVNFRYNRLTSW